MVLNHVPKKMKDLSELRITEVGFLSGDALHFSEGTIIHNDEDTFIMRAKTSSPPSIYEFHKIGVSYIRYYDDK